MTANIAAYRGDYPEAALPAVSGSLYRAAADEKGQITTEKLIHGRTVRQFSVNPLFYHTNLYYYPNLPFIFYIFPFFLPLLHLFLYFFPAKPRCSTIFIFGPFRREYLRQKHLLCIGFCIRAPRVPHDAVFFPLAPCRSSRTVCAPHSLPESCQSFYTTADMTQPLRGVSYAAAAAEPSPELPASAPSEPSEEPDTPEASASASPPSFSSCSSFSSDTGRNACGTSELIV